MSLAPFYAASLPVKLHILAALMVIVLTPAQFFGFRKGSSLHRGFGRAWLIAMLIVAITSLFITSRFRWSFMGFGFIHLLSVLTLWTCVTAWLAARRHDVHWHRFALLAMTASFVLAGAFTFLPARIMHQIVLG
jgi:uncharacterized membrane protein